jgi:purine-nucleoside phosphorylase
MMTTSPADQTLVDLEEAVRSLGHLPATPSVGIVLGSGLGALEQHIEEPFVVPYASIPHMPTPAVEGHAGHLVLGRLGETNVACLSGRCHLYEGHAESDVVFGVRLLARLGVAQVIVTNAAGGISGACQPGTLMLINDHINLTGRNPLVGPAGTLGPRFPDMSVTYDLDLRRHAKTCAKRVGIELAEGVYAGVLGPSFETPAEIRMLETLGAAAVGMSTVLEAIALRHCGIRVLGISCITNRAAGKSDGLLSHAEVAEVAGRASKGFCSLVAEIVRGL